MARKLACLSALFAMAVMQPVPANAHLSINKLWVEFDSGGGGRSDVVIRNDSEDRYYVTVSVAEVIEPGMETEHRVSLADPEEAGLLVTPNRMVLDPGALRSVRLVSLNNDLTKDRIYRVLIAPQVGEIKVDPNADVETGIAIKMLAAYEVLVVARPRGSSPDVKVVREQDKVTISNLGNTNILMTDASACPPEAQPDDEACTRLPASRLYAGVKLTLPLSSAQDKVRVTTRSGPGADPVTTEY